MSKRKSEPQEEGREKYEREINLRQEQFCKLYATDKEFFGNGVETYIEVYEVDMKKPNAYMVAAAGASRLLKNVKIINRINDLLTETGFNDVAIDKQLSFLIHQHADFASKLGAIKEYNKLKKRIDDKEEKNRAYIIEKTVYESNSDPTQLQSRGETIPGGISEIEQAIQDSSIQPQGGEKRNDTESTN